MKEHKRDNLSKSISALETKQAPDIWAEIENGLSKEDSSFQSALANLPKKEAPDVWLPVEATLPKKRSTGPVWMVAASIALFLASVVLFIKSNDGDNSTISYGTESIEYFNVGMEIEQIDTGEDKLLDYIQKNCRRLALTCNDPEFKGLLETYIELSDAKQELVEKMEEQKHHPQLMKYLIRIEKNQTDVGKDMLKKLRNS